MDGNIQLIKDLFMAIEKSDPSPDPYAQVFGRILDSLPTKSGEHSLGIKNLLLEDIEMLVKMSYLSKKSQREILSALYDSLLSFAQDVPS